ncbi:PRD domain-containing protein [Xylocopilactobacillus apis]|uniref:Transcription antiterminator LicT n=1 Tax=Xylocopilactobacillus apis TaxID=2932183 RepID=A0AAU9DNN1_9LACO|nr:PRD domain-containing protein [Xylocopilactobacillus apis]BDR56558.1 transcription antiterminator LicT [Xylocopilactobacillus apis]
MIIKQSLNNNVAFVINDQNNEMIVSGTGIAFGKHKGDEIDESKIQYYFPIIPSEVADGLAKLLADIPIEYYAIANDVVDKAEETLKLKLNDSILISLTDHMYGAVKQKEKGIEISNPLHWDIKQLYYKEYSVGLFALKLIKNFFNVDLNNDEAATIALHLVNCETTKKKDLDTYKFVEMVHWIMKKTEEYFQIDLSKSTDPIYYQRFITHIRFFIQRVLKKNYHPSEPDSQLTNLIMVKYPKEKDCVVTLSDKFYKKYGLKISKEEQSYLILHIHNMIKHNKF